MVSVVLTSQDGHFKLQSMFSPDDAEKTLKPEFLHVDIDTYDPQTIDVSEVIDEIHEMVSLIVQDKMNIEVLDKYFECGFTEGLLEDLYDVFTAQYELFSNKCVC